MRRGEERRKQWVERGSRGEERGRGEEGEGGNQQMQCGRDQKRIEDEDEAFLSTASPAAQN